MTTSSSKRSRSDEHLQRRRIPDPSEVDRLYGLEPVFEPGSDPNSALDAFVQVQCPWCGEGFGTAVELTTDDRTWVEDCQVCCRPIQVTIELDESGAIASVLAQREG